MHRLFLAGLLLSAGVLSAGEKKLMHCFAFTVIPEATTAEWKAFHGATDELPSKIPGLSRVWHGKLRQPLSIYATDAATSKQLTAGEKQVSGPVSLAVRSYGVCMEMNDEATLKTYASHPAHTEWVKVYEKVRVAGTTTFDILGQ
jgi:hypothetical protein